MSVNGVAPIKKEYLIERPEVVEEVKDGEEEVKRDRDAPREKKHRKGMNKDRRRDMKHAETRIRAAAVRLCPSLIQPVQCKFGEKCTSMHDINAYLEQKPEDIADVCPLYEARGVCPFSYACRFGKAHIDEHGKQTEKDVDTKYQETQNTSSMHIQIALRKRTYDFKKSDEALKVIKDEPLVGSEVPERRISMESIKGKKYLAPLTTVGNLPFRRICVEYGAEVTCGEMALATSVLSGTPSEFSLFKRHPSEKIFGVQLAGGFPDTMSKAAQIIVDEMNVDFIDINMGCPIDVVNQKGGGCALPNRPKKMVEVVSAMRHVMGNVPLTVKIRTGLKEGTLTADSTVTLLKSLANYAPDLITLHPRSMEQRYTHLAHWDYVNTCNPLDSFNKTPFWACGDVLSWEDYYHKLENYNIDGVMIGRGALIKPWIFTEIEERRTWDISATERFDLLKRFVDYGLDHWGSDDAGVERTRRFLLEWLSFTCRYIPVGLLEVLPQKMNDRPPHFMGRSELETLLSSQRADDWVEISKRLLGPTPEGFVFVPKHKASSY